MDPIHLIKRLYEYDTHKDSKKENAISVSTLIGSMYKAKLYLYKTKKDESLVDFKFKRSSTFGTALHERAEKCFEDDPTINQELYRERQVTVDGITYTISGCCDLLEKQKDGLWDLIDWKTFYGKERKPEALKKDAMQMSLYRWLLEEEYDINDRAWVLGISQSNNEQAVYPVELMSLSRVDRYVRDKISAIIDNERIDCQDGIKYNACNYCPYICSHRK